MHTRSLLLFAAILASGCASTQNVNGGKISSSTLPSIASHTDAENPRIFLSTLSPFAQRVTWPENQDVAYHIESGTDDGVWVEGKGYFRGSLQDVYRDLIDEKIIGPTHMTQDIVRDQFVETPSRTSFVMHVKMKYILTIEFDLSAEIMPIFEDNTQVGWIYHSQKTAGSRFIHMIDDTLVIRQIDENRFSVELQSLNRASQDKEKEARGHVETLFDTWSKASSQRTLP